MSESNNTDDYTNWENKILNLFDMTAHGYLALGEQATPKKLFRINSIYKIANKDKIR